MIKTVGIILVLSLLCYGTEGPINIDSLGLKKAELTSAITIDLSIATDKYEKTFGQTAPNCGKCSDLERLLILEEALRTGVVYPEDDIKKELEIVKTKYKVRFNQEIPNWKWSDERVSVALKKAIETGVPYRTKEKELVLMDELKKVEAEYEEKFKIAAPWWWVLRSEEERLGHLKKALETNTPYIYRFIFDWGRFSYTYKYGKASAEYEMRFKKQPPLLQDDNNLNSGYRLWRLERALDFNIPYFLMEEEKIILRGEDKKIKTEYKKKFGKIITDFELSITSIYFNAGGYGEGKDNFDIFMVRTTTGIYVKCKPIGRYERLEAELNMGEWLDFMRIMYKYTHKWKNEQYTAGDICGDGVAWRLEFFSLDKDDSEPVNVYRGVCSTFPPSWDNFLKEMDVMVTKIKKKNGIQSKPNDKRLIDKYRTESND